VSKGFLNALEGSGDLSGYPIAGFMRRTDNIEFMRTLRRAIRGEPLNATQQDDVVITLPSGKILNRK
jgi:hypothetical protein